MIPTMTATSQLAAKEQAGNTLSALGALADGAFSRVAGAPLVPGNKVTLLRDAAENYPAWLQAISAAKSGIQFENYIIHSDDVGRQFAEALSAQARQGVRVRLIYDWLGALRATSHRFWEVLRQSGVEVRCFNEPRLDSPFGWLSRDHRKMLSVDGRIAFISGLCVGRPWAGDPLRGIQPWRDTGVAIAGPAVLDIEQAFATMWSTLGVAIPGEELRRAGEPVPPAGDVALRIVASTPNIAGIYRLDQLIAAIARRSIWLTDPYFVGTTSYVEALKAAANDGVDVRLLVPRASDIPLMREVSRAGFRGLLESGVRIFEWTGPMVHAKTAVADGRWARVGSTNLNLASWMGNWELDVIAEDEPFSNEMERMYLEDLSHSVEIVLRANNKVRSTAEPTGNGTPQKAASGSAGRAAAGVLRIGNTVGAAISNHRVLGPAEARIMFIVAGLLSVLAAAAILWPRMAAFPLAFLGGWIAVSLLVRGYRLRTEK